MKPSEKTEEMEILLKEIFGINRREIIENDNCVPPPVGCGRENIASEFRDDLSRKEYTISGMCQKCQDKTFGGEE